MPPPVILGLVGLFLAAFLEGCRKTEPKEGEERQALLSPEPPPSPPETESRFYFPTSRASERLLKEIKRLGPFGPEGSHRLHLDGGSCEALSTDLVDLKNRLQELDGKDGKRDDRLDAFYLEENSSLFNARKWDHPVFQLSCRHFEPENGDRYQQTKTRIRRFLFSGRIHWAWGSQPIRDFGQEDVATLTGLALASGLVPEVLAGIESSTQSHGEELHFTIVGTGMGGAGLASIYLRRRQPPVKSIYISLGDFTYRGAHEAASPRDALYRVEAGLRHERSHFYMKDFGHTFPRTFGIPPFGNAVAEISGERELFQRLLARLPRNDVTISAFANDSEEVCDPVFAERHSPRLREEEERVNYHFAIRNLRDRLRQDAEAYFREHERIASREHGWIYSAGYLETARRAGARGTDLTDFERRLEREASRQGATTRQFFNDLRRWFRICQATCLHPRVTEFIERQDPTYFSDH